MGYLKSFSKQKVEKQAKKETVININKMLIWLDIEINNFEQGIILMQQEHKTDVVPVLINQFLFFRISFKDIMTAMKQVALSKSKSDENFLLRSLALHIYEFLDDSKDFFNKEMESSLKKLPNSDLLIKDFFKLKELFKALKTTIFKELADIRHNTAAHKELNSITLNQKIKAIEPNSILAYAMLSFLQFSVVVHFQKNVSDSIIQKVNSQNGLPSENEPDKWISVESKFKELLWTVKGMNPEIAKFLSDKTQEEMTALKTKIEELSEYIKSKNNK